MLDLFDERSRKSVESSHSVFAGFLLTRQPMQSACIQKRLRMLHAYNYLQLVVEYKKHRRGNHQLFLR